MCRLLGYCSSAEASLEDLIGADGWAPPPNRHVLITDRRTLQTRLLPLQPITAKT